MSSARLRMMAAMMKPYDAEVEYLEGSGTQYIDTGITGNLNTALEISFNIESSPSVNQGLFGNKVVDEQAISIYCGSVGGSGGKQRFGNKSWNTLITRSVDSVVYLSKDSFKVNGTSITKENTTSSFTTSGNLYLMGVKIDGGTSTLLTGKFYYAKIWDNGTLVRDYIPVRVGTTGYMYDKVSGQLFGNAGSGSFTYGNDVTG